MELSKDYKLEMKIDEFKKETGLSDSEVKKLLIKKYLLEDEGKSTHQKFADWLRKASGYKPLK